MKQNDENAITSNSVHRKDGTWKVSGESYKFRVAFKPGYLGPWLYSAFITTKVDEWISLSGKLARLELNAFCEEAKALYEANPTKAAQKKSVQK